MTPLPVLFSAFSFTAGTALGLVYFFLLRDVVRQFVEHGSLKRALPLYIARITLAVLVFWYFAHQGALALLLALLGFLTGRLVMQRFARFHA